MISIGDFAKLGRISVRMLRHYDAIGLLRPDFVDPVTGYRFYRRTQLGRLNRVVALKELGLRLEQVRAIVDDSVSAGEIKAMLRLRQAELESLVRDSNNRLARVQARLRLIDTEDAMTYPEVSIKSVAATTMAGLSTMADSATQADVGPVVGPLFPKVIYELTAAGLTPTGPSIAYYTPEPGEAEDALRVHVVFPVTVDAVPGLQRIDIPAARVASIIHRGSMETVDAAYQLLHNWICDNGHTSTGAAREIYLEVPGDPADWVTEIQLDLEPGA